MDAYTDTQMLIVRQMQRDRLAEADATRLRGAPRPPVPDARRGATGGWPRRVVARFRALAWG
jgi:hypothetical protein